jgi:hypothetical protein
MAGQQLHRRLSITDPLLTREFTKRDTGTVLARWVTKWISLCKLTHDRVMLCRLVFTSQNFFSSKLRLLSWQLLSSPSRHLTNPCFNSRIIWGTTNFTLARTSYGSHDQIWAAPEWFLVNKADNPAADNWRIKGTDSMSHWWKWDIQNSRHTHLEGWQGPNLSLGQEIFADPPTYPFYLGRCLDRYTIVSQHCNLDS